jgi:DHA1 family multidrug resistance protein-like MFS transporter
MAGSVNWKTNLLAIWLAQFLSLSAFSFSLPFLPLYLKNSGIVTSDATFWSGLFISAASFSTMIMSPIWGILGDRFGRKMMLVRANLGGAFALYLMGVVDNYEALIVLRLLQGVFTGTVPAAQTLIAAYTPDKKQGFAIGLVMAAVNAGNLTGAFLGGMAANLYGPTTSFKISGFMLLAAAILVIVAVREDFSPPPVLPSLTRSARIRRRRARITGFIALFPILLAITLTAFVQTFDGPYLSYFVENLYLTNYPQVGVTPGAVYAMTGRVSAVAGGAAVAGSIMTGLVMDRPLPGLVWVLMAVGGSLGVVLMGFSGDFYSLAVGRFIFFFMISGLASALVVVLGRLAPPGKTGGIFGWSVTVRSVGWILAPLLGGQAANWGFTTAFLIEAIALLALAPIFFYLNKVYGHEFHPEEDENPSIQDLGNAKVASPATHGRPV